MANLSLVSFAPGGTAAIAQPLGCGENPNPKGSDPEIFRGMELTSRYESVTSSPWSRLASNTIGFQNYWRDIRWKIGFSGFKTSDLINPPPKNAVLFVGSSSIRKWNTRTLAQCFDTTPVIKRGLVGSEINDITDYFDRLVMPYHPRLLVFYAGDNDIAHGEKPEKVLEDFTVFANTMQYKLPQTPFIYISIKPSPARIEHLDKIKDANDRIEAYIGKQREQKITYVDVFHAMTTAAAGKPKPELFDEDGLHLNAKGYELWCHILKPYIESHLAQTP